MEVKRIVLDTNAYSNYVRGNKNLVKILDESDLIILSVVVLGELFAGFNAGNKKSENLILLAKFLNKKKVRILGTNRKTAQIYGRIRCQLKLKGTPIPENDIWIAAQVFECGARLVTVDAHFKKIRGIKINEY